MIKEVEMIEPPQIKKKFLRFPPHVFEECRFLSDCANPARVNCDRCRVILMRDRFLGEEFHRNAALKKNVNPYILLVDSAGCNMDCWFCYAHKMIKKTDYDGLAPVFNTPGELAECFVCKMRMSRRLGKGDQDRFFSRIRVTGGEPLHSTGDTIIDTGGLSPVEATIDFYLEFFRRMDRSIREVLEDGTVSLVEIQKYDRSMPFPTWLATRPGRINIRFDTNGLLFTNEANTRRFIHGVAHCSLKNLRVEIDFSLKGAAPEEFMWATSRQLPVDEGLTQEYDMRDHPQYKGLMNIVETMNALSGELGDSLSLTIERGINHGKTNGYVNFPGSLDWARFESEANIELRAKGLPPLKLSDVDNPIQYAKQFGYLFSRYHARGACIRVETRDQTMDYLPWESNPREKALISYIKQCKATQTPYRLVFFPCSRATYMSPETAASVPPRTQNGQLPLAEHTGVEPATHPGLPDNLWILTGKLDNWLYSIDRSVWGVKAKHKWMWDLLEPGHRLIFYVSKPVGGMVGCGEVEGKSHDTSPLWRDELAAGRSLYPYRIYFAKTFCLPQDQWASKRIRMPDDSIPFQHGINAVESEEHRRILTGCIESNWNVTR